MGRTPGHLSRPISRQARKLERLLGSTKDVQSRLARRAREWHNSCEALWKEVQSLLQQWASSQDGPAAPLVDKAAVRIAAASILSKMTGWTSVGN